MLLTACSGDPTGPSSTHFTYTVVFADGQTYEGAEERGEFVAYDFDPGAGENWVATYQLGAGITIDEFLPGTSSCPTPRSMVVTGGAMDGSNLVGFGWTLPALMQATAVDTSSAFVVDSVRGGRVWGSLRVVLQGQTASNVPARFPAVLTGTFALRERTRYGTAPHCS